MASTHRHQPGLSDRLGVHGLIVAFIVVVALADVGLRNFGGSVSVRAFAMATLPLVMSGQYWRIVTASLMQPASDPIALAFSAYIMWWLLRTLSRYWPAARVVAFVLLTGSVGVAFGLLCNFLNVPFTDIGPFMGLMPVMEALGVAFSFLQPEATLLLAFVFPVKGQVFRWVGLGFIAMETLFRGTVPTASLAAWGLAFVWMSNYTKKPKSHLRAVPQGPYRGGNSWLN